MLSRARNSNSRSPRPRLTALAAAVMVAALAGGLASSAGAERAIELGKTRATPKPACPDNPRTEFRNECQITGQVTGFQRKAAGKKGLFRVREQGRIVAWSIDLAKPAKNEREAFGEAASTKAFGESPTAGISILRKDGKRKFKLVRASPIMKVQAYYGQKPVITLDEPLFAKKGDIVALTTVTWLPSFAFKGQTNNEEWVGSRPQKDCEVPRSVPAEKRLQYFFDHTRPHRKVGSTRRYACKYTQARLLYWAYFVPAN